MARETIELGKPETVRNGIRWKRMVDGHGVQFISPVAEVLPDSHTI